MILFVLLAKSTELHRVAERWLSGDAEFALHEKLQLPKELYNSPTTSGIDAALKRLR